MKTWIWPLFLALTIFTASGSSSITGPDIINFDKLAHFLVFAFIGVLVLHIRNPVSWRWAFTSILLVSGYGMFDEFRQSLTPDRSVEWQDWLADTLGACLSIFLYKAVPLYSPILETKLLSKTGQTELVTK